MAYKVLPGEQQAMGLERQAETRSWGVLEARPGRCGFIDISL